MANRAKGITNRFQPYSNAPLQDVEEKLRETLSILAFGALGDNSTDNSAAFAAAVVWLAANPRYRKLVFPAGTYVYSVSPNWAINDAIIVPEGNVVFNYIGSGQGIILDGGLTTLCYNFTFGTEQNQFIYYGSNTSQEAVYVRSVHHSKVAINVRSGGATYAAVKIAFSVCTSYYITVSGNENLGAANFPKYGLYLTNRALAEKVSACVFHNPIIEGTSSWGIYLHNADKNVFVGGTSESNGGGVLTLTGSLYNTFLGIDLEVNSIGDVSEGGFGNSYINCLATGTVIVTNTSRNANFQFGQYNSIVDNGVGTLLDAIEYGSAGGSITGTPTNQTKRKVYFIQGNVYDNEKPIGSLESTVSAVSGTATTIVTLPSTQGNALYHVHAYLVGTGNVTLYSASATVLRDGASAKISNQINGTNLTITLSGMNIQATQTSGATANVVVRAIKV